MRSFDKKSTWLKNKELNNEKDLVEGINLIILLVLILCLGLINIELVFNLYK